MFRRSLLMGLFLLLGLTAIAPARAELPAAVKEGLSTSKYVCISSTRKDGSLSKPAEIWFLYRNDVIYVGTPASSWRAKRIKWGRPQAKIAVGKTDGPSFMAKGAIVKDTAAEAAMLEGFAKKYPDGWSKFEEKFRTGFKDGSRVLIKYTPD